MNMLYVEVSAKTSENVDSAFDRLSEEIIRRINSGIIIAGDEVIFLSL